ncbi:MAG TPA: ABC transporter substrate-binding protein [Acidimicrobiia bacterium]|nr:ABC transporter substrate-binding protein [Acidimicrobiia bacterium]
MTGRTLPGLPARPRTRWVFIVGLVALVSAACGQKAGVGDPQQTAAAPVLEAGSPTTVTTGDPAVDVPVDSPGTTAVTGQAVAPSRAQGTPAAQPRSASAAGLPVQVTRPSGPGSSTTTTAARGQASKAEPSPVAAPANPRDRIGVTDKEIVIGVHAPITGAAPVPQDSVEKAKDLYWRFLAERGGIFGRNVRIVFRDDQFNPSRAVAVCRELVEQEHVFMLFGIGTDQTTSCARYASQAGVPYFATGGGEASVAGLKNFFGISMSLPQQGPMLAQMVKKLGKTKVGVVSINTPNYDDTFNSLVQSAKAAGLNVVRADRISKNPSQSEALAETNNLRTAGAEAVLIMHAPVAFLNLAHAAQGQAYTPLWAGPGLSSGLNLVAEFGCPSIAGARFLSPFPQLDVIDRFDANYKPAYRKYNKGEEPDDLGLMVWGLEKTLHQFLQATGPDLTRSKLMATLESGQEFVSNIFPPLRFGPTRHFGATQAHLLEADCNNRRYRTLATFASSF